MSNTVKHIEESLQNAYSYEEYQKLIEDLLAEGKSTTKDAGKAAEAFVKYSQLGLQRMRRWDKRLSLESSQEEEIKSYTKKRTWIVLSEGWCGDAAHIVPIINKITELNSNIELRIVLREEHLDLMNDFLTNGGKSIPKLVVYDPQGQEIEGDWGPRPEPAQQIFLDARENNVDFEEYEKKLQTWYNKDKGQTTINELLKLLK